MKVISFKRQDHCIECNSDRCIEIYNAHNRPINYTYFLDNINKIGIECFDRDEMSYMKCKKCGAEYPIDWQNKIPEPIINKNILPIFMQFFTRRNK